MTAAVVEVTSGSVSPVAMEAILSYCGVCRQIATAAAGALSSALGVQLGSTSASRVLTQSSLRPIYPRQPTHARPAASRKRVPTTALSMRNKLR